MGHSRSRPSSWSGRSASRRKGTSRGEQIACEFEWQSLITLRPSIIASSTPPTAAERPAARQPPRAARTPPVAAPEMIEFHGSSFLRIATREQSKVEKRPPHTAKLPAEVWGRALVMAPRRRELLPQSHIYTHPPALPVRWAAGRELGRDAARSPPMIGALAFTAVTLPSSRSPRGEFRAPLTLFQLQTAGSAQPRALWDGGGVVRVRGGTHTPPPIAPMANAPPMSSKMRCGHGSRS